jgi:arginine deiminase
MTYKTTTLQQLKEKTLKNPEVKKCYYNETLTIDDVEIIEVVMDDVEIQEII